MKKGKKISIIIPAYNEGDILEKTLSNINFSWVDEIIVINDGSKDNTQVVAESFPVNLINLPVNRGKGYAVERGFKEAEGDIIIIIDADLGESVKEVKKLLIPILNNKAQVAIGIIPIDGGGLGLVRGLADLGLKIITGKTLQAPLSGQRVFTRDVIKELIPFSEGYGLEIGMDIDLLKSKFEIEEVKCNIKHKVTGKNISGYIHRGKQFFAILKTLWKKRFEYAAVVNKVRFG